MALGDQFEVSAVQKDLVQCLYLLRAFLLPIDDRAGQHGQIPASQVSFGCVRPPKYPAALMEGALSSVACKK